MEKYRNINDFILYNYISLNSILERTVSRWDDFVCRFFGWDSYSVRLPNKNYLESSLENIKPLGDIIGDLSEWFKVGFDKKGIRLVNKNLEAAIA